MIRSVTDPGLDPRPLARAAAAKPESGDGGFAAELAKQTKDDKKPSSTTPTSATTKAAAPKLERTDPVAGHQYSEIVAGPRNGMYLNTSGNERHGKAFLIVERNGREFHVYGTGADREVFEVKPEKKAPAATTPAATTPAAPTTVPAAAATPAVPVPVATTPVATTHAIAQTSPR
jgi:hypothetical protein